jgi:hypothetical protein
MTSRLLLGILAMFAMAACAPAGSVRFKDAVTVHDPQATRIWIIRDVGGEQAIVLCDVAMLQQAGSLCMQAHVAPPPAGPVPLVMMPQPPQAPAPVPPPATPAPRK